MTSDSIPHIVVGIDFGPSTENVLAQAARLAERLGGDLHLCHVFPYTTASAVSELISSRDDVGELMHARDALVALRGTLPTSVRVHLHLRLGRPTRDLVALAEGLHAAMLVVGSRGRGLATLLGGTASRIAANARIPVLVVNDSRSARALSVDETTEELHALDEVVIAWSCAKCGHIRGAHEPPERCSQCHAAPARWDSAPYLPHAADPRAPAREDVDPAHVPVQLPH